MSNPNDATYPPIVTDVDMLAKLSEIKVAVDADGKDYVAMLEHFRTLSEFSGLEYYLKLTGAIEKFEQLIANQ
jgi:hypothetical protein